MSALHVVHVMEATIGGTRRHLRDVARLQHAHGLRVSVIAATLREPAVEKDLDALAGLGVHVERLQMLRRIAPFADHRHAKAIEARLRELRPDVVHSHSSKAGVLARVASVRSGVGKRVHTPHTFAFLFGAMFSPPKRWLFREVERALAKRTHAIVAVSRDEARTIEASGIVAKAKLHVAPNGIDPAPWLAARATSRPSSRPVAAVIGLLNAAKGQDLAIEALGFPACRGLELVVAGDGEERASLERRARELGVAERVRFLGWRDDVPAIVASADFVLLPSRWEGLPYVVLEAFAAGKPVVATPVDGARELVIDGRTGFLAGAASPSALADAIARMLALDAPRRAELGRAGRELVLAEYTEQRMLDRLLAVYAEVA